MTKLNEIYKCEVCGNIVSVIEAGAGQLVCCGQPMNLLEEKTEDKGREKHVPVVETTESTVKVRVGSEPHPMGEKHYITLIQLLKGNDIITGKRLRPGDAPEAEFCLKDTSRIRARALCNVHGLWKG